MIKYSQSSESNLPEDVVIRADCISKKFCRNLKRSMLYGMKDLASNFFGVKAKADNLRKHEFWALKEVSFELKRGECLGLIGQNGSGKSTLLRLLAGVFPPDGGTISIRGRVSALIALGAGFHPHMTGRENIYLNGSILGFSQREIDKHLEEILDFAEIGKFVDAPVSTYSSGMRVRLGFAIATAVKPDLLLVDEVLAVGDASFRLKCFNTMQKLMSNAAVIFVTHSMPMVSRIATQGLLMHEGKVRVQTSNLGRVIESYLDTVNLGTTEDSGESNIVLKSVSSYGDLAGNIHHNGKLNIETQLVVPKKYQKVVIRYTIFNLEQRPVLGLSSRWGGNTIENKGDLIKVNTIVSHIKLTTGKYSLTAWIFNEDETLVLKRRDNACNFQVKTEHNTFCESLDYATWSVQN
jgi:lipopolysaccharide transport system ATP-binding protein